MDETHQEYVERHSKELAESWREAIGIANGYRHVKALISVLRHLKKSDSEILQSVEKEAGVKQKEEDEAFEAYRKFVGDGRAFPHIVLTAKPQK